MKFSELVIGQYAEHTKTVTESDVVMYAGITGDFNPMHIDQTYAEQTKFGGRIAHGMLTAGFISAVLGMKLPGAGSIYMSQSLRFTRPVRMGDTITARIEVIELFPDKKRVRLATSCRNHKDETVLDGEALVLMQQ
ncbi:MAG: MaoC family dehydratase [Gemmatimonadota bacterium]